MRSKFTATRELLAKITSKGQVTIPAGVREHLHVSQGERVVFVLKPDGSVEIKAPRYSGVESLVGAAGSLKKPLSWQEMRELAREEHVKEQLGDR